MKLIKRHRTHNLIQWEQVSDSEWRSGDVRIILTQQQRSKNYGNVVFHTWHVKVRRNGRWQWAHSSQRPWGYGSAGQAKRGVSKWKNIVFERVH